MNNIVLNRGLSPITYYFLLSGLSVPCSCEGRPSQGPLALMRFFDRLYETKTALMAATPRPKPPFSRGKTISGG